MAKRLWKYFDGEPFLINPHIVAINPRRKNKSTKRRTSTMARLRRDSKGRFVSNRRKVSRHRRRRSFRRNPVAAAPRRRVARRRSYRRNPYLAAAAANPRRRRYTRRRHYRRNPAIFSGNRILGMSIREIAFAGVGFIAPPAIEGFVSAYIPTSITSTAIGRYAVKGAIVAGVSMVGGKFISRDAGKMMAIGGVTYLVANLLVDYVPQIFAGFQGYPNPGRVLPRMGSQPMLGKYMGNMNVPAMRTADRLDPRGRF